MGWKIMCGRVGRADICRLINFDKSINSPKIKNMKNEIPTMWSIWSTNRQHEFLMEYDDEPCGYKCELCKDSGRITLDDGHYQYLGDGTAICPECGGHR